MHALTPIIVCMLVFLLSLQIDIIWFFVIFLDTELATFLLGHIAVISKLLSKLILIYNFVSTPSELWLQEENTGQEVMIEDLTVGNILQS